MNPLAPYMFWIKWGLVAILLVSAYRWAYSNGYDKAEARAAKAQDAFIAQAAERAAKTDKKLADALAKLPHTRQKVEEAVRAHPTSPDCRVPDDVIARLQDGVRAGSAATAP